MREYLATQDILGIHYILIESYGGIHGVRDMGQLRLRFSALSPAITPTLWKKLLDGIMYKAVRGRPLSDSERAHNKFLSSIRGKIERLFGTFKQFYGFRRSRYIGLAKVEAELLLKSIAFNLKKAALLNDRKQGQKIGDWVKKYAINRFLMKHEPKKNTNGAPKYTI